MEKSTQTKDFLGTLDELGAHIGKLMWILRSKTLFKIRETFVMVQKELLKIENNMITSPRTPLDLSENSKVINDLISYMKKEHPSKFSPLKPLLMFGTTEIESESHICRALSNRAERELQNCAKNDELLRYVSKLSELFQTIAIFYAEY